MDVVSQFAFDWLVHFGLERRYDYEDKFIDDSEFVEYYAGDRRKAKHTGFFVNTGEIEKVMLFKFCDVSAMTTRITLMSLSIDK